MLYSKKHCILEIIFNNELLNQTSEGKIQIFWYVQLIHTSAFLNIF